MRDCTHRRIERGRCCDCYEIVRIVNPGGNAGDPAPFCADRNSPFSTGGGRNGGRRKNAKGLH